MAKETMVIVKYVMIPVRRSGLEVDVRLVEGGWWEPLVTERRESGLMMLDRAAARWFGARNEKYVLIEMSVEHYLLGLIECRW